MRFYFSAANTHNGCCKRILPVIRYSFAFTTVTLSEFSLQQTSVSPNKSKSRGESPPQDVFFTISNRSPSVCNTKIAFSPRTDTYRVFPSCESLIAAAVEFFFSHGNVTVFCKASRFPSNEKTETEDTSSFTAYTVCPSFENTRCLTPYPSGTFAHDTSFKFLSYTKTMSKPKSQHSTYFLSGVNDTKCVCGISCLGRLTPFPSCTRESEQFFTIFPLK